ncbi:hypothetical protein, partial [Cobetia sp. 29-18-1]|uniref:hypothetical protein n=1 Tax=Cobetia sp. 29-18-1 TaxID=3040018 RepID=UPI002448D97E
PVGGDQAPTAGFVQCFLNSLIEGKYQVRPIYPDDGNINPVTWSVINTHFRDEEVATFESLQEAADFSSSRNDEAPT